jgi:hypothetical protein
MALTINPDKFADRFRNEKEDTYYLALGSMAIGVPEITEKNCVEVYARHKFMNPQFPHSLDDVKEHIGMKTNVNPETTVRWLTRIAKNQFNEILYKIDEDAKREIRRKYYTQ